MKFGPTEIVLFFALLGEHSVESRLIFGEGSCAISLCPEHGVTGPREDGCWGNSCNLANERNDPETIIGSNSCTGQGSCQSVNRYTSTAPLRIGDNSCTADWACDELGAQRGSATSFGPSSLTIGNGSCTTKESCRSLARNAREVITVGDISCIGMRACNGWSKNVQDSAIRGDDEVYIGNNSCRGDRACDQVNGDAKLVSIGNNSCNGPDACRCLYDGNIKYVPDNTCNGRQCCSNGESQTSFARSLPNTKPPRIATCAESFYCESGQPIAKTNASCLSEDPSLCLELTGSGAGFYSCDSNIAPTCFIDIPISSCEGSWKCLDSDSKAIAIYSPAPQDCNGSTCLKTASELYMTCGSQSDPIAPTCVPPTLEDMWAINYGSTTYAEQQSGKYVFTSDFTFSDYIIAGMVSYRLYDGPSCGDGAGESTVQNSGAKYLESTIDITSALTTPTPTTVTIKSTVDPTKLPGSPIFDGSTVGKAVVAWCLRVMASTTGSIAKEVNFNELVYTVDVDLSAGFNVTNLSVKKRDADQASQNVSYDVEACECDGSACVTQNQQREQGSIVTVCVKPKPRATAAGVYMRSIKEFTWKRDDLAPVVSQPAIADNDESDNLLTSYSGCQGASMCVFTSILFADFYQSEGVVNGSGEAILQFGSAKSRKLRSLQEDAEVASIADFDLNFAVNPSLDGANSSGSPAGSMLFTALLAAAGTWMMM